MPRSPPLFTSSSALSKEFLREHLKTRGSIKWVASDNWLHDWQHHNSGHGEIYLSIFLTVLACNSSFLGVTIISSRIVLIFNKSCSCNLRSVWGDPVTCSTFVPQDDQLLEDSKTLGDCGFTNQTARPQAPATVGLAFRINGMFSQCVLFTISEPQRNGNVLFFPSY